MPGANGRERDDARGARENTRCHGPLNLRLAEQNAEKRNGMALISLLFATHTNRRPITPLFATHTKIACFFANMPSHGELCCLNRSRIRRSPQTPKAPGWATGAFGKCQTNGKGQKVNFAAICKLRGPPLPRNG